MEVKLCRNKTESIDNYADLDIGKNKMYYMVVGIVLVCVLLFAMFLLMVIISSIFYYFILRIVSALCAFY